MLVCSVCLGNREKGIRLLLDNVYSKTIKLSGSDKSNIRLIFNQTPKIEKSFACPNMVRSNTNIQYFTVFS